MNEEIIFQETKKQRLDKFLTDQLEEFSRSQIQKLIKEGKVLVNDKKTTVHHFLKINDRVIINIEGSQDKQKNLGFKPEIIFENNGYFILNKPVGISVEGDEKNYCIIDWLRENIKPQSIQSEFSERAGLVHRLDKGVSGLMVVSKSKEAFNFLKEQFQKRKVNKIYLGLVFGQISKEQGVLDSSLARSKEGKIVARPKSQEGRIARTEYKTIKNFRNYTFLEIKILTGRTHQIRVHFYAFNHPIVGDKLYTQKKIKTPEGLDRLFLHSHVLGFYDLNNEWQEYKSELPEELNDILLSLK
jgi:23S rRNA pseudouridine1911/1915/1917 synthase